MNACRYTVLSVVQKSVFNHTGLMQIEVAWFLFGFFFWRGRGKVLRVFR